MANIKIPFLDSADNFFNIYWGDGETTTVRGSDGSPPGAISHKYLITETVLISVLNLKRYDPSGLTNLCWGQGGVGINPSILTRVTQWGDSYKSTFYRAFQDCINLRYINPYFIEPIAKDFSYSFYNCNSLKEFPNLIAPNATNFEYAWANCDVLTSFNTSNFPAATDFFNAWYNCTSLSSFPPLSAPNATIFATTWRNCTSLTSFPSITAPNALSFYGAWLYCTSLTSFPSISFPSATDFDLAWGGCASLKSFPSISFPSARDFELAWGDCTSLTSFPSITAPNALSFQAAWSNCISLTSFPSISFPRTTDFSRAWSGCSSLKSFPPLSAPSGLTFTQSWRDCFNLTTFGGLTAPNATTFINTFTDCNKLTSFPALSAPKATTFNSAWQYCTNMVSFGPFAAETCNDFRSTWYNCSKLTDFNVSDKTFTNMMCGANCFGGNDQSTQVNLPSQTWSSILTSCSAYNTNKYVIFNGGKSKRNLAGTNAFRYLTGSPLFWSITDGGIPDQGPESFVLQVNTDPGLVFYLDAANTASYPGTGTVWTNLVGGNNGNLINGPTFNSNAGGCIRCDGVNDYIEVADNNSLDFGTSNFTVEYWFRKLSNTVGYSNLWGVNKWNTANSPGTNEWSLVIGNGDSGFGNNYRFSVEVGNITYRTTISTEELIVNNWYQLVGIREGGSLKIYLNGVLKQDVSPVGFLASSSINNVGRNLRINNSAYNQYYAFCDNAVVKIYNKALSQTEVLANYNELKGRFGLL
jgi:hypothetical protein